MSELPPPGHVPPGSQPPPSDDRPAWPSPTAPDESPAWPAPNDSPRTAWGTGPPIMAEASYGPGAGGEPPRSNNRGLIIAIAAVAVLVLIGGIVAAAVIAVDVASDDPTAPAEDAQPTAPAGGDRSDASDVALNDVLTLIDRSEVTMIQFQIDVETAADADEVEAAGAEAATELGRIKGELAAVEIGGSYADGVRAVRDTYIPHLEAWERYALATANRAEAWLDEDGAYSQDIGDTADVFVAAMENELPSDIPPDLLEFVNFILDRGFRPVAPPDGTLV